MPYIVVLACRREPLAIIRFAVKMQEWCILVAGSTQKTSEQGPCIV